MRTWCEEIRPGHYRPATCRLLRGLRPVAVRNCWGGFGASVHHLYLRDPDGQLYPLRRPPCGVYCWTVERWIGYAWRVVRRYERMVGKVVAA